MIGETNAQHIPIVTQIQGSIPDNQKLSTAWNEIPLQMSFHSSYDPSVFVPDTTYVRTLKEGYYLVNAGVCFRGTTTANDHVMMISVLVYDTSNNQKQRLNYRYDVSRWDSSVYGTCLVHADVDDRIEIHFTGTSTSIYTVFAGDESNVCIAYLGHDVGYVSNNGGAAFTPYTASVFGMWNYPQNRDYYVPVIEGFLNYVRIAPKQGLLSGNIYIYAQQSPSLTHGYEVLAIDRLNNSIDSKNLGVTFVPPSQTRLTGNWHINDWNMTPYSYNFYQYGSAIAVTPTGSIEFGRYYTDSDGGAYGGWDTTEFYKIKNVSFSNVLLDEA